MASPTVTGTAETALHRAASASMRVAETQTETLAAHRRLVAARRTLEMAETASEVAVRRLRKAVDGEREALAAHRRAAVAVAAVGDGYEAALDLRREAIRDALAAGATLRAVGAAVFLSRSAVSRIARGQRR